MHIYLAIWVLVLGMRCSLVTVSPLSATQIQCQANQAGVCRNTQGCQDQHRISTGSKFMAMDSVLPNLGKELFIALGATEETNDQDSCAVYREQRPYTIELGGEDLEDDEGEGELRQSGPDIGTFKGTLGCTHFHDFV